MNCSVLDARQRINQEFKNNKDVADKNIICDVISHFNVLL